MAENALSLEKLKIDERLRKVEQLLFEVKHTLGSEIGTADTEGNIRRNMREIQDKLKEIATSVREQNGRTSANKQWIDRMVGSIAILTVLIVPVIITIITIWIRKGMGV